jgi:hypothetical protein
MASGRVRIDIDADAGGLRRGVSDAEGQLHRLNGVGRTAMAGLTKVAAAATVALGVGFAAALRTGTSELLEQEKASGRTKAVIESTGAAAGVTARHVEDLASSIQRATGSQDDLVQSGANVLLQFTKIGAKGGIFDRATIAANDFAVATGKDMPAAAKALGKALDDPIKGLGLLSREGIKFTDQEKERLKTLTETNRIQEAQAAILDKVEERFKGTAASEGEATEKIQQAQRRWEDMSEALTQKLLPVLSDVLDKGIALLDWFDGLSGAQKKLVTFSAVGVAALAPLAKLMGAVGTLRNAGGVLAGGGGALAGRAGGPVPVFVTNPGFAGGIGGGGVGGRAGAAIPGIGTLAGGGIGLPLAGGAALIAGGIGLNTLLDRTGIGGGILPSAQEAARNTERAQAAVIAAWRRGRPALQAELQKSMVIPAGPLADRFADAADDAIDKFRGAVTKGGPKVKNSAKTVVDAAAASLRGLEPTAQRLASDSMIRMSQTLENQGRLPRGATVKLVQAIEAEFGKLPGAATTAAQAVAAAIRAILPALSEVRAGIENVYSLLRNPPKPPPIYVPGISRGRQSADATVGGVRFFPGGNALSPTDRAGLVIEGRARNDSLQDKRIRAEVAARSAAAGVTNPDEVALRAEEAVLQQRRREVIANGATLRRAQEQVKAIITRRKKNRAAAYKRLRGVKGNSDEAKKRRESILDSIRGHNQAIRDRYDELNALIRQAADLEAEARELDFDIGELAKEIANTPDVLPDDTGTTPDTAPAAPTGPTPDQQAQLDQAAARAAAAESNLAGSNAFFKALRESSTIDPGSGGQTVVVNIGGTVVEAGRVASWITSALAQQGVSAPGVFASSA